MFSTSVRIESVTCASRWTHASAKKVRVHRGKSSQSVRGPLKPKAISQSNLPGDQSGTKLGG